MMNILFDNNINKDTWCAFVTSHPKGNVFQTPEMFDAFAATPGNEPHVIALEESNRIVALMVWVVMYEKGWKKRLSMRSVIQGGPLVENDKAEWLSLLLREYEKVLDSGVIYTQIRNHNEMLTVNDAFQECGYRFHSHLNFIIALDNEESVWNRIGKGRIKQIRKAQKNNLSVTAYTGAELTDEKIEQGYAIIETVYKRAGLPLVDIAQIKAANQAKLLVLFFVQSAEGEVMGCRFGLLHGKEIYGWYAGSESRFYNLYPNDILIWETLRWGIANGYEIFDYGGAGEPNKPYGVRAFKQQMGGTLVNFGRYEKIHHPWLYKFGVFGLSVYKVLKRLKS